MKITYYHRSSPESPKGGGIRQAFILVHLFCLIGLLFLIRPFFHHPVFADESIVSIDVYWQKLAETQDIVVNLDQTDLATVQAHLETLATEWEAIKVVAFSSENSQPIDHSYLVAQLRQKPPDLARLETMIQTLLAHKQTWPEPQHDEQSLEQLVSILARSEFQWPSEQEPSAFTLWWRRMLGNILDFIFDLLPDRVADLSINVVEYSLIALAIAIFALVIFFLAKELMVGLVAQATLEADDDLADESLTAECAFKQAQDFSTAGDYRTAVRYLYLSSLLRLDERGILRYDRTRTNREYLRSVAHLPHLSAILGEVIEIFDQVWYGYQDLDAATYTHYATRVMELRQQK